MRKDWIRTWEEAVDQSEKTETKEKERGEWSTVFDMIRVFSSQAIICTDLDSLALSNVKTFIPHHRTHYHHRVPNGIEAFLFRCVSTICWRTKVSNFCTIFLSAATDG